jgi:hypothetical protein
MMQIRGVNRPGFWGGVTALCMTLAFCGTPSAQEPAGDAAAKRKAEAAKLLDQHRVPLAVARDRAKVMHDIYSATLDVMHHRYFHGDRAVVPARALEDVFATISRDSSAEARWIAVNLQAMNIDHEPETDFEKQAAREIAAGKAELEVVEGGYYRRAGEIPLAGGCVSCHAGFFRDATKTSKFAGLVISVPISDAPKSE